MLLLPAPPLVGGAMARKRDQGARYSQRADGAGGCGLLPRKPLGTLRKKTEAKPLAGHGGVGAGAPQILPTTAVSDVSTTPRTLGVGEAGPAHRCVCPLTYACLCVRTCVHTCSCVWACLCVSMSVCVYVHTHVETHMCLYE